MNLFDTLNEALTDEVVSKIAKISEEEPEKAQKAINAIFYTLIAGLVRRSDSMMSVGMLYNQVQKGGQNGELINNILSYINTKDSLDNILKTGDKQISQVFPAYKSPVVNLVGTHSGIKKSSATMYTSLATPILMDALNKEMNANKWEIDGLAQYLADHHEPLFSVAPEDFMQKMIPQLGLQELVSAKFSPAKRINSVKAAMTKTKANTTNEEKNLPSNSLNTEELTETSSFPIKWLVAFLIVAALAAGGFYWYKNYYEPSLLLPEVEEALPAVDSTNLRTDSVAVAIDSGSMKKDSLRKDSLAVKATSFLSELNTYLADNTKLAGQIFPMTNVNFIKGTQVLDTQSATIIDELAALLNKNPKMQIQLRGHSNTAVGMENRIMATKRAFAVKKLLLMKGIVDTRIDAIGTVGAGDGLDVKIVTK